MATRCAAALLPLLSARLLVAMLGLLSVDPAAAAEATDAGRPTRVMLVHGVWVPGPWQKAFQAEIDAELARLDLGAYEISHQLLGLYARPDEGARSSVARYIESTVAEQGIEWVVCTLQEACRFLVRLDLPGVHRILVAPDAATVRAAAAQGRMTAVRSGADPAIEGTLEHVARLRPGRRVHLLSGTSTNDRAYLAQTLDLNARRAEPLPVTVVRADTAEALIDAAASLDPRSDVGFLVTAEAYGDPPTRFPPGAMARLGRRAAAPVFVFWDAAVGLGPVGGRVTSAGAYAGQVAALIARGVAGQSLPVEVEGAVESLYDAARAEQWDLDLSRLVAAPTLVNVRRSLWETNRPAVLLAGAIAALLVSVIVLLGSVLYATRRTYALRARLAAEEAAREEQARQGQKMEALGNLAAGIAHDFNNVLGVIVGLTELMRHDAADGESREQLLDRLSEAADRAKRLVRQILTFSRQSRDVAEPIDLTGLVARTAAERHDLVPPGVALEVDAAPGEAWVVGDPQRLEQVLANLLGNALEAVAPLGGRVCVTSRIVDVGETRNCTLGVLTPGRWAEVRVEDDGPGIPDDVAGRIFEPFYTSKALGSGIGLSIVHSVVEEHHGALELDTAPDRGARFSVFLPASASPAVTPERDTPAAAPVVAERGSRLRVLLVDDQEALLRVLASMGRRLGHEVTARTNAREALELLDAGVPFDVVVTDFSMPEMDGLELIRTCASRHPQLPCVLNTGYAGPEAEAEAHAAGAVAVLAKPVDLARLRATLDRVGAAPTRPTGD